MQIIPKLFLTDRHNQLIEDITHIVRKGTVSFDPDRSIKGALKLEVNDYSAIQPYRDYLAPFLTVIHDDGYEVTSQMGLYAVVPPAQTIGPKRRSITLDGYDLTWVVGSDVFDEGYSVSASTNVVTAVEAILTDLGFTRMTITPSSRVVTSDRSWKPGTSKLEVINDLLNSAGYHSLYATKAGYFASSPYESIKNIGQATIYDTTDPNARVKVLKTITLDSTSDRIVNKVVVIKDNADEAPIVVTKLNTNPLSPTSIQNLDMTITKVERDSNLIDEAAAETKALRLLEEGSMVYRRLKITTSPDLERDALETYRLNIVDANGQLVADGLWNCRGWSIGFTPSDGFMTHNLSNVDYPPAQVL